MKPYKGPRSQGGWVVIGMAVAGIAGSIADQKAADKQNKQGYGDKRDISNLEFEQNKWLAEQTHKFELEDYQRQQNYKEDAIRGFAGAAPPNQADPNGQWGPAPAPTDVSADTANLAQVDANGNPLIYDPRTGLPVFANAQAPAKPGTLTQLAG